MNGAAGAILIAPRTVDQKDDSRPQNSISEIIAEAGAAIESGLDDQPRSRFKVQLLFDQLMYIATYLTKLAQYLKKLF